MRLAGDVRLTSAREAASPPPRTWPVLALTGAAVILGTVVGDGNPAIALAPILLVAMLWAICRLPLRYPMFAMTFATLAIENPNERAFDALWTSPWNVVGRLFFQNLHQLIPIPILRVSGMELLLMLLVGLAAYRRVTRSKLDHPLPSPRPLRLALLASLAAIAIWVLYGLARGGDFKESIWQFRSSLTLVVAAFVFQWSLRGMQDYRTLGRIIVAAALWKVLIGAYFFHFIAQPQGEWPSYVTQHGDSVLYTVAVAILLTLWWERPTLKQTAWVGALLPFILYGLLINERRLAYVSLAAAGLLVVLISPWNRAKRFLARAALLSIPLAIGYVAVGWSSNSRAFKPVRVFRSVLGSESGTDQDGSTEFRNMENFNIIMTWHKNPLGGSGFGHPYDEVTKLPDISKFMPSYKFMPHNGLLWLWMNLGFFGFTLFWGYVMLTVFYATRAYHAAVEPTMRATCLVCLATVVAYVNQVFGDMGTQTYNTVFTLAPAVAVAGQLAMKVGAWRDPARRGRPVLRTPPGAQAAVPAALSPLPAPSPLPPGASPGGPS